MMTDESKLALEKTIHKPLAVILDLSKYRHWLKVVLFGRVIESWNITISEGKYFNLGKSGA